MAVPTAPVEARGLVHAGVDLTQWAALMEGYAMKAQPEKPPKFFDQPLINTPNLARRTDGKTQLTLKEWMDAVDVYLLLCGLKDPMICFLYAMSLLGGQAKLVMEAAIAKPQIIRVNSKTSTGEVIQVEYQPNSWPWIKEILKLHYNPVQRQVLLKEKMREVRQGVNESVTDYYLRFSFYASQLEMGGEEQYGDFRAGLLDVYRVALNRVLQVRSTIPGAPDTMNVTEALNIALQEEATSTMQAQHSNARRSGHGASSRDRPYSYHWSGYNNNNNSNRPRSSYGNNAGGKMSRQYSDNTYRHNNQSHGQSQSNPAQSAQLAAMESRRYQGERDDDADGNDSDGEENAGQFLNAAMSSSSFNSHPSRSGYVSSPASASGGMDRRRCWICNQSGHFKSDCPQRGKVTGGQRGGFGSRSRGGGSSVGGGGRGQGKV